MSTETLKTPTPAATAKPQKIWLNGQLLPKEQAVVSVFDHGLLYGDGVFEGIRAYGGKVFRLAEHLERLYRSARALCLEIPLSPADMEKAVLETCRANGIVDGYVRLVVTRGTGDLGLDRWLGRYRQPGRDRAGGRRQHPAAAGQGQPGHRQWRDDRRRRTAHV